MKRFGITSCLVLAVFIMVNIIGGLFVPSALAVDTTTGALTAPVNMNVSFVSTTSIKITWDQTTANETGFEIQRKKGVLGSLLGTWSTVKTTSANVVKYTDTGLAQNTVYTYRVRAINTDNKSSWSNTDWATTIEQGLRAPIVLLGYSTGKAVKLSWIDNSLTETSYRIERKVGKTGTYSLLTEAAANSTKYTDTNVSPSKTYYYRVRANGLVEHSAYSPVTAVTVWSWSLF